MVKTFLFSILSDSNWEVRVGEACGLWGNGRRYFEMKDYGTSVDGIVLVVMCRSRELNFKQRKRFSKKEKIFHLDIMLDYIEMVRTKDILTKSKMIANQIEQQLFPVLNKYKFEDFDLPKFHSDLTTFLTERY